MIIKDTPQQVDLLFNPLEKEVMRLICQEKSSKEIGKMLNLSKKKVDNIRAQIMGKTESKSMSGIVVYAIANKIFKIN